MEEVWNEATFWPVIYKHLPHIQALFVGCIDKATLFQTLFQSKLIFLLQLYLQQFLVNQYPT